MIENQYVNTVMNSWATPLTIMIKYEQI